MNSFLISKKKSPTHLFHYRAGLSFFQHAEINFYLLRIIGKTSNDEIISYICLKFLTLYQFARTNVKNEWAVRLLQHGINFVDTDVAIFCCLPNGQKHLLVNWYVLLDISPNYDYVDTARRIDTAEELCRLMLEDVALDVLLLTENEHSMETADPLERAEIQRLWQPYFEQLPEYEYLREVLTSEWP